MRMGDQVNANTHTIKGIEVMRALRKGQAESFYFGHPLGEMHLVSRVFEM